MKFPKIINLIMRLIRFLFASSESTRIKKRELIFREEEKVEMTKNQKKFQELLKQTNSKPDQFEGSINVEILNDLEMTAAELKQSKNSNSEGKEDCND